ncbi:RNA polymerase sigma-70 factor [Chondrinema litorale]|uniref:RNA polymerase sigma-70 factor n=1 Tax=Chondrinema litorale TaxID=2994555 RepID=UPI002542DEA5|nr:RNA polymerase sigma-70 factor [Chondrinema litorale]UZR93221.1 RNA polymerase sigma-70 factor [Chondrinema litorale]
MNLTGQPDSDQDIMESIANDDELVFKKLFETYYEELIRFAIRHVRSPEVAEGIVQEVFLYLWEKRKDINLKSSLRSYLYAATRYQAIYFFREQNKTPKLNEISQGTEVSSGDDSQLLLEFLEVEKDLNKAVDALPPKCKEIYQLSREEGLSYKQIAEKLHISVKTVENQLIIALKRIRLALAKFLVVNPILIFLYFISNVF